MVGAITGAITGRLRSNLCFVAGTSILAFSGHVDIENIRAGDVLVLSNGKYVTVEKIQHKLLEKPITVYNFEVEDFHTCYVGTNSILVHNACKPDIKQIADIAKSLKLTSGLLEIM